MVIFLYHKVTCIKTTVIIYILISHRLSHLLKVIKYIYVWCSLLNLDHNWNQSSAQYDYFLNPYYQSILCVVKSAVFTCALKMGSHTDENSTYCRNHTVCPEIRVTVTCFIHKTMDFNVCVVSSLLCLQLHSFHCILIGRFNLALICVITDLYLPTVLKCNTSMWTAVKEIKGP